MSFHTPRKPRPPITSKVFSEVVRKYDSYQFSSSAMNDLVRAGWCVRMEKLTDLPETPHWQVWSFSTVVEYSGYDNDPGTPKTCWSIWLFDDESLWQQVAQEYFEAAVKQPTQGGSLTEFAFLDAGGRVVPKVTVTLSGGRKG